MIYKLKILKRSVYNYLYIIYVTNIQSNLVVQQLVVNIILN